ncbi:uncharacterized protein VTP21DRAFT_7168 [Calcarisporiella thermophila]|uniref:uncharacterized protein n=1 Tax=Calcarisporiella thermophila TaxID=911321 RepID=UPI0037428C18
MNESERWCTEALKKVLESPRVIVLLRSIYHTRSRDLIRGVTCRSCSGTLQANKLGYYCPEFKRIVICSEHHMPDDSNRSLDIDAAANKLEDTVVHELVHAYDANRFKHRMPFHTATACSEIRASNLGQCSRLPSREKEYCVINDSIASLSNIVGEREAARLVRQMFAKCFKDKSPFL